MVEVHEDRRATALVVDDDRILRMDVTDILEQAGFRTLEAGTGDDAMAVLEQHHLDVALLFSDVEMPGTRNGLALAQDVAVKSPYIAIVIASGRMGPSDGDLPEGAHSSCYSSKIAPTSLLIDASLGKGLGCAARQPRPAAVQKAERS